MTADWLLYIRFQCYKSVSLLRPLNLECFVEDLAKRVLAESKNKNLLKYNELAKLVDTEDTLQFLQDIVPQKVMYGDYLAQQQRGGRQSSSDESS